MAKLMVVNDRDPGIAVIFEYTDPGTPGTPEGWRGRCTECGPNWVMHRWHWEKALADGQHHVDMHR